MKQRYKSIDVCGSIEEETEVSSWQLEGLDIWPILKVSICHSIATQELTKEGKKPLKRGIRCVILKVLKKMGEIIRYVFRKKMRKTDVLFLAASSHDVQYDSRVYNRFFEPLLEKVSTHSTYLQYSADRLTKKRLFTQQLNSYDFENLVKIKSKIFKNKRIKWQESFFILEDSRKAMNMLEKELGINETKFFQFLSSCLDVLELSKFYEKVLHRSQPNLLIVLNYYCHHGMALVHAAKRLNIKSIDLQHGPQLSGNVAYSSWKSVPEEGYNTMPDQFWCWDNASSKAINKWASKDIHTAFVGGNPWLDFWQNKFTREKKNKIGILYTLQPLNVEDLFPDYLCNFIKEKQELFWTIRYHPRQSEESIESIERLLIEKKISNLVKIEDTFSTPLPIALMNNIINITHFSGTAIEASLLGIPTVIINPLGKEFFQDLIQSKKAFYFGKGGDFKELVFSILRTKEQVEKLKKTDKLAINVFNKLLSQ